jgi:predicted dehydrogenase
MTESSPRRLRIGVLGAANIARLFVEGVRPSPRVAVVAVAGPVLISVCEASG